MPEGAPGNFIHTFQLEWRRDFVYDYKVSWDLWKEILQSISKVGSTTGPKLDPVLIHQTNRLPWLNPHQQEGMNRFDRSLGLGASLIQ